MKRITPYQKKIREKMPSSPILKDCAMAFLFGGGISALSECILSFYVLLGVSERDGGTLVGVTWIFLASLLTGLGIFDRIARHAGAGTLVPITGFANAVVSPAIDTKSEGLIVGVGAKIFTVAGPVILYGILSGAVYGVLYFLFTLFS